MSVALVYIRTELLDSVHTRVLKSFLYLWSIQTVMLRTVGDV